MDNTTRFTNRADAYARFRPHYPVAIIEYLRHQINFSAQDVVADIGSGTGISTELFLKNGNTVWAVEPNDAMRAKATELLQGYPEFISVDGTAEQTGLETQSIDLIVAGQAFHWFEPQATKIEFLRIAKPDAHVLLFWNIRAVQSGFAKGYEELLLAFGTDYTKVGHKELASEERIAAFFATGQFQTISFENGYLLDYEAVQGRLLSTSYAPDENSRVHTRMLQSLKDLFTQYAVDGKVRFDYTTHVYLATAGLLR